MDYIRRLQQGLSPLQRLNQITEHGMCIGCGLCASLVDGVDFDDMPNGYQRPISSEQRLDHASVDAVNEVCPGTKLAGLPPSLTDEQTKFDDVWGAWHEIYFAYSNEPDTRHLSSTGGLLTGLALYLIESNTVDFILHAK